MRFSVVIPAHNTERWIEKCLKSIREQTFKDYEIIVVCDACTDETEKIARQYADRVEVVDFHTDGLTRNKGLEKVRGEYVIFVDSDDWLLHEYVFELLDEKLTAENNPDVLAFSFIIKNTLYATPRDENGNYWTGAPTKVYKTRFIQNVRFSPKKLDSDVDFTNEIFSKKPRIVDWDMPLYYYNYLREGSYESARHGEVQA